MKNLSVSQIVCFSFLFVLFIMGACWEFSLLNKKASAYAGANTETVIDTIWVNNFDLKPLKVARLESWIVEQDYLKVLIFTDSHSSAVVADLGIEALWLGSQGFGITFSSWEQLDSIAGHPAVEQIEIEENVVFTTDL